MVSQIVATPTHLTTNSLSLPDRLSADDLLGTIDVPLKDLMNDQDTHNRISIREDRFLGSDGSTWPGTLSWECGYFSKTTLEQHLEHRHQDVDEIKDKIEAEAEEKLREAKTRDDERAEIEQQKKEDLKEKTDEIIAGSKPTQEWPSGILSIKVEQINGLEVEKIKQSGVEEGGEDEESDDLPSAYCTVIINHQRVYKTRTKLKTNKPFVRRTPLLSYFILTYAFSLMLGLRNSFATGKTQLSSSPYGTHACTK